MNYKWIKITHGAHIYYEKCYPHELEYPTILKGRIRYHLKLQGDFAYEEVLRPPAEWVRAEYHRLKRVEEEAQQEQVYLQQLMGSTYFNG